MKNLKKSDWLFLYFLILFGCSSSGYRVHHQSESSAEIILSPDRIILECEFLHDADIKGLYGFMIHVLDKENTVFTVIQGNTLDKESCDHRLIKIGKIIEEGQKIYLVGLGNLYKPKAIKTDSYTFSKRGTFFGNGRVLQFVGIANDRGACYDTNYGEKANPCPREPFPTPSRK